MMFLPHFFRPGGEGANQALAANGGGPSRLQSAHRVGVATVLFIFSSCAGPSSLKEPRPAVASGGSPSTAVRAGEGVARGLQYLFGAPLIAVTTLLGAGFGATSKDVKPLLGQLHDYEAPAEHPKRYGDDGIPLLHEAMQPAPGSDR